MTYYVTGNLNHDGKPFKRGDTIDNLHEETAAALLASGAIQEQPLSEEASTEPAPEPEQPAEPQVGGKQMESGEPSIDGPNASERREDNATDVTPEIAERDPAPEPEQPAKAAEEKPAQSASERRRLRALSPDTKEPEVDPSAGL